MLYQICTDINTITQTDVLPNGGGIAVNISKVILKSTAVSAGTVQSLSCWSIIDIYKVYVSLIICIQVVDNRSDGTLLAQNHPTGIFTVVC